MPKRERATVETRTQSHLIEAHPSREHVSTWVQHKMAVLIPFAEVRVVARRLLAKSRGVVVSSTMALSTAIIAMRGHGDFSTDSTELNLMQAVLRYSEMHQVPPKVVMELIAEDDLSRPD